MCNKSGSDPCNSCMTGSSNVKYDGPNLPCTAIHNCDSLNVSLQKIDEQICDLKKAVATLQVEVNFLMGIVINTTTTTTSNTTTSLPPVPCGSSSTYSGEQGYPITQPVIMGTTTGIVTYNYDAYTVPDRFIVRWNGNIVVDTGYRGDYDYDFGGGSRSAFTTSLTGQIDPITLIAYPDFVNYPDDGYPRVTFPPYGTTSFNKNLPIPTSATVEVYAPMPGTLWQYTMSCPQPTTTTTTTIP